jgi:hypothetical protein
MKIKSILFFAITFLFIGCSKNDKVDSVTLQETGKLAGKVLSKNGIKPIGGALVFVLDTTGKLYKTNTDKTGDFVLDAPVGNHTLQIQTGDGSNFRTSLQVDVLKNQTVTIPNSSTKLEQVARMAYVLGSYDNIQSIVSSLGYAIEGLSNEDLKNYNKVAQYDIIFLNCGGRSSLSTSNSAVIDDNLENFVTNGGSLYASDWAVAYLIGGTNNSDICNEVGGFIPDDKLCATSNGPSSTITGAQVTNTDLANSIGFTSLDITFDLGSWEQINSFDPNFWDVLVNNPTNNKPLMIKTNQLSSGLVTVPVGVTASDNGWVTICHSPNENNPITITVNQNALEAHQAHGDSIGACSNTNNSGAIYFTTFHNHAGENIGNAGLILEYVILNL